MKKYPNMRDSKIAWIGEIPDHWKPFRQGQICEFVNGYAYSITEFSETGYPIIRIQNLNGGNEFLYSNIKLPKKQFAEKGDLLFAWSATFGPYIWLGPKAAFHYHQWKIIPKKFIDKKFLYYYFQKISNTVKSMSHSGIGMVHMTKAKMEKMPIFLPDFEEQIQISQYLDSKISKIESRINKNLQLIKLLKEKKSTLITQVVTGGLDSKDSMQDLGVDLLKEMPDHWNLKRVKFLKIDQLQYGANDSGETDIENGIRYIRITDIGSDGKLKNKFIKYLEESKARQYLLKDGDILLARSGATVGKGFIYDKSLGKSCFAGYLIRFRPDKEQILPSYFYYLIQSKYYWNFIGSTNIQATIQNVSAEKYSNFYVPLPPLNEQKQILDLLDSKTKKIDSLILKTKNQINKLQEYIYTINSLVITGKIDIRDKVV